MKSAVVAAALATLGASKMMFSRDNIDLSILSDPLPPLDTAPEDLFKSWQKKFGKQYSSEEYGSKKAVFMDNLKTINNHNQLHKAGNTTWTMGLNQFSDLTAAEFKKTHLSTHKRTFARNETVLPLTPLDSVDWRTKGAVTPVKNQGQCGSCWSFSTTGSTEGAWAIAGHKLTSLSEQQLMDCSTSEGDHSCQGGLMDYGFEYIIKNGGIDTEADYPYKMRNEACESAKEKNVAAMLKSYTDVPKSAAQLEAAIAKGPVSVAIEADQSGFQHYNGGTFSGTCGTKLDHGVLAVGYSPDYWIVKNSWGETWGNQGYIKLSRSVGFPAGNQCGILNSASYPIAGTGPVPPTPPSPGPSPGKWTTVEQSVYRGFSQCSGTAQTTSIPVGKCVPDSDGAFIMSCSDDGSSFVQTQFSDSSCQVQKGKVPGQCGACLDAGVFTHVEFTCQQ